MTKININNEQDIRPFRDLRDGDWFEFDKEACIKINDGCINSWNCFMVKRKVMFSLTDAEPVKVIKNVEIKIS